MLISVGLMGSIRLLLPFSAWMVTTFRFTSMSVHLSVSTSPIRAPVSLRSWSSTAVFGLPLLMSASISCSVGMKGNVESRLYFGLVHVLPM